MDIRTTSAGFAERVQSVRREAGLTVEQLAERSGIAYRTLRRRLDFPGGFSIDELAAIAESLTAPSDDPQAWEAEANARFAFLISGHLAASEVVSA